MDALTKHIGQMGPLTLASSQCGSILAKNTVVPFPYYCKHDAEGSPLAQRGCSDREAEAITQRLRLRT